MERSMLKKVSVLLIAGLALAGCDNNVPAGGQGYFDQVGPAPLPPAEPVDLRPTEPADMTSSLTNAVEAALANSGTTTASTVPVTVANNTPPTTGAAIVTDDGSIDLNASSLDQQIIDRNEAARVLEEARTNRVVIEPGSVTAVVSGVNIAAYARQTTHAVGERQHRRPVIKSRFSATECRKFSSSDNAQRNFMANGGPVEDPLNLDPDGDGFACAWTPDRYRLLQ